jgi:hypothetical protein
MAQPLHTMALLHNAHLGSVCADFFNSCQFAVVIVEPQTSRIAARQQTEDTLENPLDMMNLTSGLTTSGHIRVNSGQASSCHSEPKY